MPTKCMDQMPVPITREPVIHHMLLTSPFGERTRIDRSSVTNDASVAITTETATIHKS